jgi:protein subunit release factor B
VAHDRPRPDDFDDEPLERPAPRLDPLREQAQRERDQARAEAPKPRGPFALDRAALDAVCEVTFVRGSGPGGQHRNKVETGVRLVHPPSGIAIVATDNRSQYQNREAAFERLIEKLRALNARPAKRKKTKPSRSSKKRRLGDKKQRGDVKRQRRSRGDD